MSDPTTKVVKPLETKPAAGVASAAPSAPTKNCKRALRSSDATPAMTVEDYIKWKSRNQYYYDGLSQLFQLNIPAGARVLEIGCGDGDLLAAVQPKVGVGIDINGGIVKYASRRHPGLTFHVADGHDFDIDQQFDHVILNNLFGEVDDVQQVLQQIQRVCHYKLTHPLEIRFFSVSLTSESAIAVLRSMTE